MQARGVLRGGLAVLCVVVLCGDALARRNNPPPGVTGSIASAGNNCSICHVGSSGSGSVQILGAPALYQFNQVYNLTVRVSDPTQAGAGFELSAEDAVGTHVGNLIVSDAINTQINTSDAGFINHTGTGVNNSVLAWAGLGNAAEYDIEWQAPASDVGTVTFYAAGNAINNNGVPSGDHIYTTSVSAIAAPAVPAVSTWGLLALTLTGMTAGTILFSRKLGYNPTN
jgi:hypothetical protein